MCNCDDIGQHFLSESCVFYTNNCANLCQCLRYSRQAAPLVLVHGVKVGVQVDQSHGAASEVPGGAENTPGQGVVTSDTWVT